MVDDTVEWIDQTIGPAPPSPENPPMAEPVPQPTAPTDPWVQRIYALKDFFVAVLPYLVAIGGGAGWAHSSFSNGNKIESVTSELKSVTAKVDESARLMTGLPPMVGQTQPVKQ